MRRLALALVLFVSACGAAASGSTSRPTPTCADPPISPTFAWPAGITAAVIGHDRTESVNEDGSSPMHGDSFADLRLTVELEGDGRLVRFATEGRGRLRSQGFAPDLGGTRPEIHLDGTGRVARVVGADAMRARVESARAAGEIDAESAAMLLANTTEAAQLGTAAAHWDWALHAWHGGTFECGVPVRSRATVPSLSFGTATVTTESELEYAGAASCGTRALGDGGCVALTVRQRDVDGSGRAAIAASGMGGGLEVANASFSRTIEIVAEPSTLVLHLVSFEEHWEITWRGRGGTMTRRIRDLQEYSFDYDAGPPRAGPAFTVTRAGGPVVRPPTPNCRWIDACCAQLSSNVAAALICVSIPAEGATDCTDEEVAMLAGIASMGDGGVPPACMR